MKQWKIFVVFITILILIMGLIIYGFYLDHQRRINTRQALTVFIEDIQYENGGFGHHDITIVKTNISLIILDDSESLPLGHVMLTIQESIYTGEFKLISCVKVE